MISISTLTTAEIIGGYQMGIFNHNKVNSSKGHSPIKHMFHMIICCGLPIFIIFSLPFIAGVSPVIASVLGVITPFICPVMMGGMLFMMLRSNKHSCCEESKADINQVTTK
jgi:hypothetical protein